MIANSNTETSPYSLWIDRIVLLGSVELYMSNILCRKGDSKVFERVVNHLDDARKSSFLLDVSLTAYDRAI